MPNGTAIRDVLSEAAHSTARSASLLMPNLPRFELLLFLVACVAYIPGIWWGTPPATAPELVAPWGSDELGPLQALHELHSIFLADEPRFNPQYPLFHYLVQAIFAAPYLLLLLLTGGLTSPSNVFPYGLQDPATALAVLTIVARLTSLLMGAATVVVTYRIVSIVWDRRAALYAALLLTPCYIMLYYSRTSNVDVPALFWIATSLWLIAIALRNGLTTRRAIAVGAVTAIAIATKDPSFYALIGPLCFLIAVHLRSSAAGALDFQTRWWPIAAGGISTALAYVIASGLLFHPDRFFQHLEWVRGTSRVFVYPATLTGYGYLLRESAGHVVASVGLPTALLGLAGILLCAKRDPLRLWLLLPAIGIVMGVIVPVRFVAIRFVLVVAFVVVLFAGYALSYLQRRFTKTGVILLVTAVGWSVIRGLDLTQQMLNDGRYAVAEWLDAHVRPAERIGYFGAAQKLPPFRRDQTLIAGDRLCSRAAFEREKPEFVLIIPQQHYEGEREWTIPDDIYNALDDGSLGYTRLGLVQARTLFSRRPISYVNPPVQIFIRSERAGMFANSKLPKEQQPAFFQPIEARLGLVSQIPPGLIRQSNPRIRPPCVSAARFSESH